MELILPTRQYSPEPLILDTKVLVVIGANGSGKTSFGKDLQRRYDTQSIRISGMHSLFISSTENE